MSKKFIPNGHLDFVTRAESFARVISVDPAKFEVADRDVEQLTQAVARFRAAIQANQGAGRSEAGNRAQKDARKEAEEVMRRLGHVVRANPRLDNATKISLGIRPREAKAKVQPCPQEPPRLRFVRAHHESSGTPMHELSFTSLDFKSRAPGATRLELFVGLVPPETELPDHPGLLHTSFSWYMRSYTRSPIKVTPPIARVPMRVVYWARWAGSSGDVGRFSGTVAAWIEGGSHAGLPGGVGIGLGHFSTPTKELDVNQPRAVDAWEQKYSVAVLEAKGESLLGQEIIGALPAPEHSERETRQLEGPVESEAA